MKLNAALAAAASLVAIGFGLATLDRWLRRRRPHELAWTVALTLFTLGGISLWLADSHGWSAPTFRLFFLTGAVLNVPWLGLGSVYLLLGHRWGDRIRWWLILLSGLAVGVIISAPMRRPIAGKTLPKGSEVFGAGPRILAAVGSAIPATFIIVGALWSVYRILRHQSPTMNRAAQRSVIAPGRLALGNVLIAAGSIVLSASGTVAGRLGEDRAFAVTLLLGIILLFAGFMVASTGTARRLTSVDLGQRAA